MSNREELHWDMQDNQVTSPTMNKLANGILKRLKEREEMNDRVKNICELARNSVAIRMLVPKGYYKKTEKQTCINHLKADDGIDIKITDYNRDLSAITIAMLDMEEDITDFHKDGEGHIFCKCPGSAEANVIDEDFQIDLRRCTCPGFTSQMKQIIGDSTGQEAADKIDEWIKNNPDYIVTGFIKQLKIEKEYFKKEANP